jgi:hypothetical protein
MQWYHRVVVDELVYYRSLRDDRREVEDEGKVEGGKCNVRVAETIVWFGVMVLGDDGHCTSTPIIIPQLEASSKSYTTPRPTSRLQIQHFIPVILVR